MKLKRLLRTKRKISRRKLVRVETALILIREEDRCKLREKELREKDILIQDNLIRFSSFLQQQETRRKKDLDSASAERKVSEFEFNGLLLEN